MIEGKKRALELGYLDMPGRIVDSLNRFPIECLLMGAFDHLSPRLPE